MTDSVRQLLKRVREHYATCSRYSDTGLLEEDIGGRKRRGVFSTTFCRPNELQFSFEDEVTDGVAVRCTLRGGAGLVTLACFGEVEEYGESELAIAVAGAGGATSATAYVIPALLLPELGYRQVVDVHSPHQLPNTRIHGVECSVIEEGRLGEEVKWTLAFGVQVPFIHRMEERGRFNGDDWNLVRTYRPEDGV